MRALLREEFAEGSIPRLATVVTFSVLKPQERELERRVVT